MIQTIVAPASDWSSIDTENLARFLDTDTGKRFLTKLASGAPELLDRGHMNKILIRTGEVRGYKTVLQDIMSLAHPPAPNQSSASSEYPPLEDDRYWEGQKLNDPEPKIL